MESQAAPDQGLSPDYQEAPLVLGSLFGQPGQQLSYLLPRGSNLFDVLRSGGWQLLGEAK